MKIIFGESLALGEEGFFAESRAMWLSTKVCFFFNFGRGRGTTACGPASVLRRESSHVALGEALFFFELWSWLGLHVGPPGPALRREPSHVALGEALFFF
jgi:hypothetical protein